MRKIITTVGTSLLTNRGRPWEGWEAKAGVPLPEVSIVREWLAEADMAVASAESNTLQALGVSDRDEIVFLHSDTEEGAFCAKRLAECYGKLAKTTSLEKIGRLGYGASVFSSGLKSLVDLVIKHVRQGTVKGQVPVLCATGGFKAEIAFLNLMGALLEIEVVYIHELHRQLVRLPRLPLSWDTAFAEENLDFFEWVEKEPRRSLEVESWLKGRPHLRSLVEDDRDGYTYLTAAGNLLFRVAMEKIEAGPRAEWPFPDPRSPQEKNKMSSIGHHRPPGWERFVERLCAIDCVSAVRFEKCSWKGPKVRLLDPRAGEIAVRYGDEDKWLTMSVSTTARGEAQTSLVAQYIATLV